MDEASRLYAAPSQGPGTHLALRWKGRVRYIVPREAVGQRACWRVFRPGMLAVMLRGALLLPKLAGVTECAESAAALSIREAIGAGANWSCCRTGAPGPWSKDTLLYVDNKTGAPLSFVKAGAGAAVAALLRNEAEWLRRLGEGGRLAGHVPKLIASRCEDEFSFVAQSPLTGDVDFSLGQRQLGFLRGLRAMSAKLLAFEQSQLYDSLRRRQADLRGLLDQRWATRLGTAMQVIEEALGKEQMLMVAAHNDFTPWNIRLKTDGAQVFDWEYAAEEQLPLFDALHFALLPMALKNRRATMMDQAMWRTIELCRASFEAEFCYEAGAQALAYLVNVSTLYLWSERGNAASSVVLGSYAALIDRMIAS